MAEVMEMIKTAIQMEKDGKAFYTKAAAQTSSPVGSLVFMSLAEDEDRHLAVFSKIFESHVSSEEWDLLVASANKYATQPVFPNDPDKASGASPDTDDVDAIQLAMTAEKEAIEYYMAIKKTTDDEDVRKALDMIIDQERNHFLILEGEFEYLSTSGSWHEFTPLGQ